MTSIDPPPSDTTVLSLFQEALSDVLAHFERKSPDRGQRVARALAHPVFNQETLGAYIRPPGRHPYGRSMVFQNEYIELIAMNWGSHATSLPHDHGTSEGWVRVISGVVRHGLYKSKSKSEGGELRLVSEQLVDTGTIFRAPKGLVHHMGNGPSQPTVTLHCYFPPIHRMEVFDLTKSRAAIVADDCGAWWPESERQIVEVRDFAPAAVVNGAALTGSATNAA